MTVSSEIYFLEVDVGEKLIVAKLCWLYIFAILAYIYKYVISLYSLSLTPPLSISFSLTHTLPLPIRSYCSLLLVDPAGCI